MAREWLSNFFVASVCRKEWNQSFAQHSHLNKQYKGIAVALNTHWRRNVDLLQVFAIWGFISDHLKLRSVIHLRRHFLPNRHMALS